MIISASRAKPKAIKIAIRCTNCRYLKHLSANSSFGNISLPRHCDRPRNDGEKECPLDPFVIEPDNCKYIDQQTLKLQESPEEVPTGEIPRHILLSVDRSLVDKVPPGTRVTVLGVSSVFNSRETVYINKYI